MKPTSHKEAALMYTMSTERVWMILRHDPYIDTDGTEKYDLTHMNMVFDCYDDARLYIEAQLSHGESVSMLQMKGKPWWSIVTATRVTNYGTVGD